MSGSSTTNTCNFYSELATMNPIKFTWKIDQLKTFLQLYETSYAQADQISCQFQGNLNHGIRDTWILRFENQSKDPYVILQRISEKRDRVFVCAEVLLLNSENINVFSHKSEFTSLGPNDTLWFKFGMSWPNFIDKLTDGVFTIKCTVEQKMWNNVKTCNLVTHHQVTEDDQLQRDALAEDFKNLLESSNNSDVSFKLMNGTVLPAHKAILSARSPVFQRMFMTEMKEAKDNLVQISDIREESMKALLSYIYTGKLDVPDKSAETFKDLVYAADKYQLNPLKELCDNHLPEYCDTKNAFDLLNLARSHELKAAEDLICTFIEMNISSIIKPLPAQQ